MGAPCVRDLDFDLALLELPVEQQLPSFSRVRL